MGTVGFLENYKVFRSWGSKTYEYKYLSLIADSRFRVFDLPNENPSLEGIETIVFGWHAISLNKYYTSKQEFYRKKIPDLETKEEIERLVKPFYTVGRRYLLLQDLHTGDYEGGAKALARHVNEHFHGVITPYLENPVMDDFRKLLRPGIEVLHLPHHIDERHFKVRDEIPKIYDILTFGNDSSQYYPFRYRLMRLIEKSGLRVKHIPKPTNYFRYNPRVSDTALSKMMNQSILTLCTSSKFNYLLGKYFEAGMSGSIVCGDMPRDGLSIWEGDYLHLDPTWSDDRILDTIRSFLERDDLPLISERVRARLRKYHLRLYPDHLLSIVTK